VILSGGTELWEAGFQGLTPRDMAMNVALPEVDGRIITRAVSFKAVKPRIHNCKQMWWCMNRSLRALTLSQI
jgi:cobaltochelatase CobN